MDIAQDIVQHTIGVLVLIWVVGYTILRAQEAMANHSGGVAEDDAEKPEAADDEDAPDRGTFAYAQRRRAEGKPDAPFWGALAAAKALLKLPFRRKPTEREGGEEEDASEKRERRRRKREWRPYDEDTPEEPVVHDDDTDTWGGRRGDSPADDDHDRREAPDITVEQVPRYGPRDPELERPVRALDPAAPEAVSSEPEPVLAEVIRIDTRERTPPVSTGTMAPTGGGGVAAVGDMNSHEVAMVAANAIVRANGVCVDGMGQVIAILNREIQVVSQKIDSLQANGITGSVLAKWLDQLAQLQVARNTAVQAKAQIDAAHALAAAARANQAAKGNPVQAAVTSAGTTNVADKTGYYGT